MASFDSFWKDLKYSIRSLAKKPGFTAVALFSLTLGIGANATIFTLVKAVFLQPIAVKDPATLVAVYSTQQSKDGKILDFLPSSFPNAVDYRAQHDATSGLSVFYFTGAQMGVIGEPVGVGVQLVNWDFFDILGVKPMMGRVFLPEEDQTLGGRPVVILSHRLWTERFAKDPNIVNKPIHLNGQAYTVVGVMPESFHDLGAMGTMDMWAPLTMREQLVTGPTQSWFSRRGFRLVFMVARLKPGVSPEQAQVILRAMGARLAEQYPAENSGRTVTVVPLSQTNVPLQQRSLFVLAGTLLGVIVGLVLLIACGNVANLQLARATQRRRELAVRISLGASRGRLIQQMLTESMLLGLMGAALGLVAAYWARDLLWLLLPGGRPRGIDTSLDLRVFAYTLGVSLVATLLCGLLPALQASKTGPMSALTERGDAPGSAVKWYGVRGALVMTQVALSLIALVGSGLFIHSLMNAQEVDPGFEVKRELMVFMSPGQSNYTPAQGQQFYLDVLARVRALPMVADAGISTLGPFQVGFQSTMWPEGSDHADPRNGKLTPTNYVLPGLFSAAGITMLKGRDFTDHDEAMTDKVVIVNQALAEQFWPAQEAIGKHLYFRVVDGSEWNAEIIAVVKTVKNQTLGEPPAPIAYLALRQQYQPNAAMWIRAKTGPDSAVASVRTAVQGVDPKMNIRQQQIRTSQSIMDNVLAGPRLGAQLLGGFGLLALLLAAIGTYGVMSYTVSQRTQEIGIRIALGAQRRDVLGLVLGNGMSMVFAGVAAGLCVSMILIRSVNSLLYGIGNFDGPSFLGAGALLVAVGLLACMVPARRAMRVDPIIALRYE